MNDINTNPKPKRPWTAISSILAFIGLTIVFFLYQKEQNEKMELLQEKLEYCDSLNAQLNIRK